MRLLLLKFIFNWGVSALQYCVVFCHISTWISHRYTCVSCMSDFCMDWNLPPSTSCPVLLSSGFQGPPSTTHFPRLSPGTSACSHTLHSSVLRSPVSSSVPAAQMCLYFQFGVGFVMHLNRDQRLIFSIFIFQILGQGTLKNNLLSTSPLCETVLI